MKKVVIYPGRFQPMLPHHANVYTQLQAQFPDADVYISTSDKVEPGKSPFNFKEKAEIMSQMHNIPMDKIIQAKSPYLVDSYAKSFDQDNTMVIFAVGAKDEDRFPMKNLDPNTGLDMTVRGEARPKYYQMINTLKQHPALPMGERGYVYNAPTVKSDNDEVASASAFRNAFVSAPDEGSRKEIFNKYMGTFDNNVYDLFTNKLLDKKMKEDIYNIDVMKYLAGQLNEAPINFDEPDDDEDYRPGFTQDNMINQLGKIIDSDDASKDVEAMKIKKFTPVTKVSTDDNKSYDVSPAEAKALKNMFNMLSSARQGEEQSAREKFQSTIQTGKGLLNMIDFAHQKNLVKEENIGLPTPKLDLDDIRSDYAIEEDKRDTHCSDKCCGADVKREDCVCESDCEHCNCNAITEVAGPKDCWDGYKKDGTQPGTGKNKGKRVNKCVKEEEADASVGEAEELNNLRKRAGLEEKEETEPCPKCGKTRHVLKACASCGCS